MRREEFFYELPRDLIAQYPSDRRGDSRLLYLNGTSGKIEDRVFSDLPELLRPGDLLVFNDTRVLPARLFGRKETGGQVEILIERLLGDRQALAQLRASKTPRVGARIRIGEKLAVEVISRQEEMFVLEFHGERSVLQILERYGHVPLPPYIEREDEAIDSERYQTVYARKPGAVAAPTAGLHFTGEILRKLGERGIRTAYVTLHIGAGTFQPVRSECIEDHRMHSEYFEVSEAACDGVYETRARAGRVIAVGTTTVRCLEQSANSGTLQPCSGETDIFIYPGYRFRVVDGLITNFHLPESTLLMLVCAFAGREQVLAAYRHAIAHRYRFYSYGDAMLINK